MDLKQTLKTLKLYESTISMVLGAIVIAITAFLVFSYFRNLKVGSTSNSGAQTSNETKVVYTVAKGDTLWAISQKYYSDGFQWKKIADANQLTSSTIEVGTELTIPETGAQTTEVLSGNKFTASSDTQTQPSTSTTATVTKVDVSSYTVAKGDSLWKIAVKIYGDGYKWSQIAKVNNLQNPDTIYSGTQLRLP